MKSQVKILFVITQGFWGGAQKYVLELATNLGPSFDISLALGSEDYQAFRTKITEHNPQIKIYPLKHLKREISPLHDLLAIKELKKLYTKLQADIVHLNSSKAGFLGSLAKTAQTKIIYTAHGWVFLEPLSPLRKKLYQYIEQYSAKFKDAIIVLSKEDEHVAQEQLHIEKSKLHTIALATSDIAFLPKEQAREKLLEKNPHIDMTKLLVMSIANHYPTKGLDILIDAIGKLSSEEQKQLQLCIIGDGPERTRLQTDINLLHLENTIFLIPFIENAASLLKAADLFVLPSRKEGLPYALLEALQAQIPIIATLVGGIPSLLKNKPESLLIAPEDSAALQDALQKFLKNPQDFKDSAKENKKESVEHSLSQMIEQTNTLYTSLLRTKE
jgi:glycosyltransferase involved in cell wall biosynthesis